jgi:hypothetical protein
MSIQIKGVRVIRDGKLVGVLARTETQARELRKQAWGVPVVVGDEKKARSRFRVKKPKT